MCGIAGFISNYVWRERPDPSWMDEALRRIETATIGADNWEDFRMGLDVVAERFDDLMSFGFHFELARESAVLQKIRQLALVLEQARIELSAHIAHRGSSEILEQLAEDATDCAWQIREEVLGNVTRSDLLLPEGLRAGNPSRAQRFVAWAIEQVMENLDRLEVRGRDSAGISVQCLAADGRDFRDEPSERPGGQGWGHEKVQDGVKSSADLIESANGRTVVVFGYKVANLVGRLGDNTAALRRAVRADELLWRIADEIVQVNIIAHTRWASNGIISLSNCHPVDGSLYRAECEASPRDRKAQFVLNGDVDNYHPLLQKWVYGQGYAIDPLVTTDAKILPVFYRLGTAPSLSSEDRFAHLMRSCDGSLAVVMQHPDMPHCLHLGQKGSGQSLFVGKVKDGLVLASEVYGLASRTRRSYGLSGTEGGGTQVTISVDGSPAETSGGRFLEDGSRFEMKAEPIYIHSRDIFRGSYDYFFEKEIHEAPNSVRKTIKGKYKKITGKITFNTDAHGSFGLLVGRLRDPLAPPIRRIMVIGQGTASVAAMGVAYLIERSLGRTRVTVGWCKASEMSGFFSEESLEDLLLIAISQSGTTTDTNRTVDVAGSQGAWIHAIVNRRNSPLVAKSDSHFYTSDGRDVEMAVASTKAFYSQIAAGKLTALLLAQEFGSLTDEEIYQEIQELERLPEDIEWVLGRKDQIRRCAEEYGPCSRNWAVVGNGPNKIAADEIRIKLSELCYKSIPCDFTEDKKHIDLSTEPLTIVVANDLPEQIVQDTAKEVAIFKAHSGKPLVLCARGEKRFDEHAAELIELPVVGAGLGFVSATVAGHLWGFYAAKAIDARADDFRDLRSVLTRALEEPETWDPEALGSRLSSVIKLVAAGEMNAALPASTVASLATYAARMNHRSALENDPGSTLEDGISILNRAIEEMTRPIDSIRHQAKTVTVGISRPPEVLPPLLLKALEELHIQAGEIRKLDRRVLAAVSPIIAEVGGGLLYEVVEMRDAAASGLKGEVPLLQVTAKLGVCEGKPSRYDEPRAAGGSKRTALRVERAVWSSGKGGQENLLLVPLFEEEGGSCRAVVLFHVAFVPEAPLQKKIGVLRATGNRYHEMVERLEELSSPLALEDFLDGVTPRDLMLAPVESLILSREG